MLVFLLQELSDVDLSDEQELCDSLVEDLQVSFLWTVTDHHLPASVEADTAGALFSEMTVHFCEQHALFSFLARLHIGVISFWMYVAWPSLW